MTELRTIDNVAEDRALIAVRAWHQALNYGYGGLVLEALRELGLDAYAEDQGHVRFALDPEGLAERMETLRGQLADIEAYPSAGRQTIADRAYRLVHNWRDQIYNDIERGRLGFTENARPAPEFDAGELETSYGLTGALPRPSAEAREAIEASRKQIMAAFLDAAVRHNPCSDFEGCAKRIGLTRYLPKRDMEVSAEVPGLGEVKTVVQLDRRGQISPADLVNHLRQAAYEKINGALTRDALASGVKGLPDGALA